MFGNKMKPGTGNSKPKTLKGQAAICSTDESVKARHLKGQAAMEYLMTYGWAILVIVIVLAALWFLSGQFFKAPENCLFSQPGLSCGDTKPTIYNEGGVVKLSVQVFNQQGQPVIIHQVLCTNAAVGDIKTDWKSTASAPFGNINAGASEIFTGVECLSKGGASQTSLTSPAGSDFRGQFVIWYNFGNDVDPSVWRQTNAAITGSVREKVTP